MTPHTDLCRRLREHAFTGNKTAKTDTMVEAAAALERQAKEIAEMLEKIKHLQKASAC